MNLKLKHFLIKRDILTIEKKTTASQGKENNIMSQFETNDAMEILIAAKESQPALFAQLPAAQKMAVGIYEAMKTTATNGLTADEKLKLAGLKQSVAKDNLAPSERISKSLEIQNLENRIGDK